MILVFFMGIVSQPRRYLVSITIYWDIFMELGDIEYKHVAMGLAPPPPINALNTSRAVRERKDKKKRKIGEVVGRNMIYIMRKIEKSN